MKRLINLIVKMKNSRIVSLIMFLIMILFIILMICTGCSEYIHKPDEISIAVHASETNFGFLGRAPTTGLTVGATWYRNEK